MAPLAGIVDDDVGENAGVLDRAHGDVGGSVSPVAVTRRVDAFGGTGLAGARVTTDSIMSTTVDEACREITR